MTWLANSPGLPAQDGTAVTKALSADPERAAELASVIATNSIDSSTLLVVDQFEEVFTLCTDESERQGFIAALCAVTRNLRNEQDNSNRGGAVVLIGMRADFYERACAIRPCQRGWRTRRSSSGR